MKVMISYPPLKGSGSPMLTQNRQFQWYHVPSFIYPLVPAMAATLLKNNGFDVIWNDCIAERRNKDDFFKIIDAERPDIIAFETKTPVVKQHWAIIDHIKTKYPSCETVLMGDHVTALPQESMAMSKVDYVITGGDYDFLLLGIAMWKRNRTALPAGIWYREDEDIRNTGQFDLSGDLNTLPFIDRRLTKAHLYGEKWKKRSPFFYTLAGRDCPWAKCTFCAWTTTFPKFRVRTPESVLNEIGILISDYGVKEIFDDTGTFPSGGWLRKFCEGMIERGYNKEILFSCNMRYGYLNSELLGMMKKAGFRKLKMGLESANQKTLDILKKGVKVEQIITESKLMSRADIDIQLTVMVGYPWETRDDVQRTLDLAGILMRSGSAEMLQATVVVPYPGTPLYQSAIEQGWFSIDPSDYGRYDMREPILKTPDMSSEDVMKMCRGLYQRFLTPRYILRHVGKIRGWEDMSYVARGAKAVIGHLLDFKKRRQGEHNL